MRYLYTGPLSSLTLPFEEGETPKDITLQPQSEVDLPEDWEHTQILLERGHLQAIAAESAPPTPKAARKEPKES